jgi:hypothetical protein
MDEHILKDIHILKLNILGCDSNEVQASKAEGLEGHEDGRCLEPSAWGYRKLQQAKANHTAQAREAGGVEDEGHPIIGMVDARRWPHGGRQTVGFGNGRQLNLLEVYVARRDRRWPSTQ